MNEMKHWYALYTRSRWEKKVAELLTKKQVENYCPLNRVQRQWSDRRKIVMEPLFRSYVFVRMSETEHLAARSVDGVINLVYWQGRPAIIRDAEIDVIRKFLNDYEHVKLEKTEVDLADKVRITHGPLMLMEGKVVEVKHKTVRVLLPSLGYAMIAEIDKNSVEKINLLSSKETVVIQS